MPLQATSGAASYDAFGGGVAAVPNYIEDVFSTYLYTGNGTARSITNGIDLAGEGGLVWIKNRSRTGISHELFDSARVITSSLRSDTTGAETSIPSNRLTSFNPAGFSLGADSSAWTVNNSGDTYVSWTFRKQPKFFDVVTYTGDGVAGRQINHSLGSVPGCVVVKATSNTTNWAVNHSSLAAGNYMKLNDTSAVSYNTSAFFGTHTSTTFQVGSDFDVNASGYTYVAYLFAHNAGGFGLTGTDNVISCGSFTTDGSGNATVSLGYEPQWLLYKSSSTANAWIVVDTMRGWNTSATDAQLAPNLSNAEVAAESGTPNATGFNVVGVPSQTYIYIAIRRGPMKVPTTGTSVFMPFAGGAGSTIATTGFPSDLAIQKVSGFLWENRLVGDSVRLDSSSTASETTANSWLAFTLSSMNQMTQTYFNNLVVAGIAAYAFRRAPGFFDEVCYTGTGSATTVAHNLAAVPELMIVKSRSSALGWVVYAAPIGNTQYLFLNATNASATLGFWNNTTPTASVFSVGAFSGVNNGGTTYVAYLFASAPGVSKVGSYTGTGATQVINCGFTGGARFVLIKSTSTTGDWYVWDSARGIVAGNDPYLLLNSTAAEVTTTDWVDTAATGFELSNAGGNLANSNGVSYIFLAIA